jgi:hypothetical protein
MRRPKNPLILAAILASTFLLGARSAAAQYKQKNLVSNQHGMAIHTDRHLINGWGLAFFPHGPFWVADEGAQGFPPSMGPMANRFLWWLLFLRRRVNRSVRPRA